ncbi:MAG: hypothetical protein Q4G66_04145 [bacterium]|nr:hypothetical protein [bacterium]
MKKTLVAWALIATFIPANALFAAGITGSGNIGVYKDGKVVERLTGESQVSEDSMLVCNGQCTVQSSGIRFLANDQTKLAVRDDERNFDLFLSEGRVDFTITSAARTITFHTPQGTYTTAGVVFSASAESAVRGWAQVGPDGATEIGVTEGQMVFTTANGEQIVDANHKIQLAVSEMPSADNYNAGAAAVAAGSSRGGAAVGSGTPPWVGPAVFGGLVTAGLVAALIADDNDGSKASNVTGTPSSPAQPPASPVSGTTPSKSRPKPAPAASPSK